LKTLTIRSAASSIHERLVSTVSRAFNVASSRLPISLQERIDIVTGQTFRKFQGAYRGSGKIPDAAILIETPQGNVEVKFILEVGMAEAYDTLVDDARMWLEGTETVSVVMLVKMEEDPPYQSPLPSYLNDDECSQPEDDIEEGEVITEEMVSLMGPYGPAVHKGVSWVGTITGFTEIWTRDPVSHVAIRTLAPQVSYSLRYMKEK